MKVLIFLSYLTLAYGGVGVVTPEIEAEALRLWEAICNSGDSGVDGEMMVYCKKSQEVIEETLQHDVQLKTPENQKDQVVFVQPPSYAYKHDIIVSGGGGSAPKTVIYVKPSRHTHEVNIDDKTEPAAAPQKPTLYFLKGEHSGSETPIARDAATPEEPPTPTEGARRRRQNAPGELPSFGGLSLSAPQPKKRVVYILRRI